MEKFDFDYIVVGSGFGGSVSAHRLSEKGYKVAVMEMGKRYRQEDFPKNNWHLSKYLWAPFARLFGFFRMTLFKHVWVLSGVGVGGGSLVYANTLLVPKEKVWDDPNWKGLNDWKKVIKQHYTEAQRMLGVTQNPYLGQGDRLLREAAESAGYGDSFYNTDVGVYFGKPGETVPDPYFGGEGPERTGCLLCGGCMVGCRHGAKNTLDMNYLWFAEKRGTEIFPETKVIDVKPLGAADGSDGYEVTTKTGLGLFKKKRKFCCKGVVFSAGVMGTVKLLMQLKERGSLPQISDRLGDKVRTNSESIIGVKIHDRKINISDGIAIGSGFHVDEHTHIELCRYSNGSDSLSMLTTLLTNGKEGISRIFTWLGVIFRSPIKFLKMLNPVGFARSSMILLVMQTVDNSIRMKLSRRWYWPFSKQLQTEGEPIPTYIPVANQFAQHIAKEHGGTPLTAITEILLNVPTTAHILGGAPMGKDKSKGVIDGQNRVFDYKNMLICDGSMIGANLGVNPSLTITAITEHAMSHIPEKGGAIPHPKNDNKEQARPQEVA